MKKKTILFLLLIVIAMISVIIFIEINRPPSIETKTLVEENTLEIETELEHTEEDVTIENETIAETEESDEATETLSERVFMGIQDAFNHIFNKEVKIVAIGDSLTQGVGDDTKQGGYVGILERSLNKDEQIVHFENFGKRGNRSEQMLERLQEEEIQAAIETADFVLVTIGANNIMKVARENFINLQLDIFQAEREHFEETLRTIASEIHTLNEDASLFLIGIYNPFELYFQDIEELTFIIEGWNETIHAIAEDEDFITFIPIADLFQNSTIRLLADDNFHPNYDGYFLMAERVLDYITDEEM